MDWVILVGRILFFLLFAISAAGHITQREMMSQYAAQKGVLFASLLVPLTGLQILVGSLMVLLGIWADLGAALLALFLVPTAFLMHNFWTLSDPAERQQDQAAKRGEAGGHVQDLLGHPVHPGPRPRAPGEVS